MVTEETFITLYVRHETELRSFARSIVPRREDAADVVQDACVAMWRKLDTLQSEKAFRSWAYSYVRLTALNQRRKNQASPLHFSAEMIEIMSEEWEEEGDLAYVERNALAHCLKELPERQCRLLALYYAMPETTAPDLSKRLQKPVAGIYKALARAKQTLRKCVETQLQPGGAA